MEPAIRRTMEDAFSADFSDVRLHVGGQADQLADRFQARAFATGNDVFIRRSEYSPTSAQGQHLLAHELAHTLQDSASTVHRLMTDKEFKKASGGAFSGKRSRVLMVDKALGDVSGAMSRSVALDQVIYQCQTYLSDPASKDSTRVKGVKKLLAEAIAELTQWRARARMPLPDFVFRTDTRSPADIAKAGFQPWKADGSISMIEHVTGALRDVQPDLKGGESGNVGALAKMHSQYVSTAATLDFVADPVLVGGLIGKNLYKIATDTQADSYADVGEHFDSQNVPNPYEKQYEFVQQGGIPGSNVIEYCEGKDLVDFALGEADASSIAWKAMPAAT